MNDRTSENKKVYIAPTITDHGKLTEETKGINGTTWEVFGHTISDDPKGN